MMRIALSQIVWVSLEVFVEDVGTESLSVEVSFKKKRIVKMAAL